MHFGSQVLHKLRAAAHDLIWLLNRGYAETSSLKLVGDRYQLVTRQRQALARAVCNDSELADRLSRRVSAKQLSGQTVVIDGFNVLVTVETALGGGVVLEARDSCWRDMSSIHGSYRRTAETHRALVLIGKQLQQLGANQCRWYFDRPVSNSGRLVEIVRELADQQQWCWTASTVDDPDNLLARTEHTVATADSIVLDRAGKWFNLARWVIQQQIPDAWVVSFVSGEPAPTSHRPQQQL